MRQPRAGTRRRWRGGRCRDRCATAGIVGCPVGVVGGALIGGAAGGATGAATKPNDVNLGAPPWHDDSAPGQQAAAHMAD
jgi:hypothetical protein